jgi:hypothetical protein
MLVPERRIEPVSRADAAIQRSFVGMGFPEARRLP